jgi:enoyl-CoA hydratase
MIDSLLSETRGQVLLLSVNRPERRNALDPPTLHALAAEVDTAATRGMRAIVLTGVGDVAFGSGMDLGALRADATAARAGVQALRDAMDAADRPPVIAAVNGDAMGGGFELVLRCELVVAADHARFGLPEVTHGLLPGSGATLLPCRIPLAPAMMLVIAAERITADEARALGLVNRVVGADRLRSEAIALAARIATHAPLAVAGARRALWAALDGREHGWEVAQREVARVAGSADMREGLAAFAEHRTPHWRGC